MITNNGTLVRTHSNQVRECGRSAQGVRLINLRNNEKLIGLKVVSQDGEVEEEFEVEEAERILEDDGGAEIPHQNVENTKVEE